MFAGELSETQTHEMMNEKMNTHEYTIESMNKNGKQMR